MVKKQFKTESKKLMDLMINSIYKNKEIFIRELISNASDAIDKLHYQSLVDKELKLKKDFAIWVKINKADRTITISDNGCGMSATELENNLGTIAQSGSAIFKQNAEAKKKVDIIGQFGIGFYSAFMVASQVTVISKSVNSKQAYKWQSSGVDGYTIEETTKADYGTDVILTIKQDKDEDFDQYLDEHHLKSLIKKYSDYITHPIKMNMTHSHLKEGSKDEYETIIEEETVNSLTPLWQRNKTKIKDEEYETFYLDKFTDFEKPLHVIHSKAEGTLEYNLLLFIPAHAPYDYYTKEYEKGLQLYANGVLIMEKCPDLLPDYFSFCKGVVDSSDLSLNISRETLQQDRVLKNIAKNIENKIKKELEMILSEDRNKYEQFFKAFGMQLKFGVYNNFGLDKDKLQDLLMFVSSKDQKLTTLKEYVARMTKDQKEIYYACGESVAKIDLLPQVESVKEKGYEILYLTEYVDEFTLKSLLDYEQRTFVNVATANLNLDSDEEQKALEQLNAEAKDMFAVMQEAIREVKVIRFTRKLKNHPVCLSSEGNLSIEMEKAINALPTEEKVKAETVLEINEQHDIAQKLRTLYKKDKAELKNYTKIIYAQARLIEGLPIDNPTEISSLVLAELSK